MGNKRPGQESLKLRTLVAIPPFYRFVAPRVVPRGPEGSSEGADFNAQHQAREDSHPSNERAIGRMRDRNPHKKPDGAKGRSVGYIPHALSDLPFYYFCSLPILSSSSRISERKSHPAGFAILPFLTSFSAPAGLYRQLVCQSMNLLALPFLPFLPILAPL